MAIKLQANGDNVSADNPLPVALVEGGGGGGGTAATAYEDELAVAATGTPEALADAETLVDVVSIKALSTNTSPVKIGFSAGAGNQKWELVPTEWISLRAPSNRKLNLAAIYVACAVNGEGVAWHAFGQ
jgi:hypothetical protein